MTTGFASMKGHLREYLESQGVNTGSGRGGKTLACINPAHKERTPSMALYEDHLYCFGACKKSFDIFDAACFLEGLPAPGTPNFFEGNALVLAERFGVDLPSQGKKTTIFRVYAALLSWAENVVWPGWASQQGLSVAELLESWNFHPALSYVRAGEGRRVATLVGPEALTGSSGEVVPCPYPLVVRLPAAKDIRTALLGQGFDADALDLAQIREDPFMGPEYPILPFWTGKGQAVSFMVRLWGQEATAAPRAAEGQPPLPKYKHTAENELFKKKEYLYGLQWAIVPSEPLWVVEGQKDAYALRGFGHQAVALGGSSLTDEQLETLIGLGPSKFVLALDKDRAGEEGAMKALEKFFKKGHEPLIGMSHRKDFYEDFETFHDPSNVFVEPPTVEGTTDGVLWYIERKGWTEEELPERVTEIYQLLDAVPSVLRREGLLKAFAGALNLTSKTMMEDYQAYKDNRSKDLSKKVVRALRQHQQRLEEAPDLGASQSILQDVLLDVSNALTEKRGVDFTNVQVLDTVFKRVENMDSSVRARDVKFRKGGLETLNSYLDDGIGWTEKTMFVVGGDPHAGKTAFLDQFMVECLLPPNDHTMVLHLSTDDSVREHIYRMMSSLLMNPHFAIADGLARHDPASWKAELQAKAIATIRGWLTSHRLVMKDGEECNTLGEFTNLVKYYRDKNPEKTILVVNDNLHRNMDFPMDDAIRRSEKLAMMAKHLSDTERITFWATVEMNKGREYKDSRSIRTVHDIPELGANDISGDRVIKYNAKGIFVALNDYAQSGSDLNKTSWVHEPWGRGKGYAPRVRLKLLKNKITGKTGTLFYDLVSSSSYMKPVSPEIAIREAEERFLQLHPPRR